MHTILALILIGIGTWRVAYMFIFEDGPGDIFANLRKAVGVIDNEDGSREIEFGLPFWKKFLASLLSCIYCLSMWIGMVFAAFYSPNIQAWILYVLWCSFVAIFIEKIHEKLFDG